MLRLISIALILLAGLTAQAALVTSNLLTLATVNLSTNTGAAVYLGTSTTPTITFSVQSIGTGGTNWASGGTIWFGHSTNFSQAIAVGNYQATNDTVASFTLTNNGIVPDYFFFQSFNTSSLPTQIGAQAITQH